MKYDYNSISNTIKSAIKDGTLNEEHAKDVQVAFEFFDKFPHLFDSITLGGAVKCGELSIKLTYWCALKQLTYDGYKLLKSRIPEVENVKWNVYEPGHRHVSTPFSDKSLGPVLSGPCIPTGQPGQFQDGDIYLSNGLIIPGGIAQFGGPLWDQLGGQFGPGASRATVRKSSPQKERGIIATILMSPLLLIAWIISLIILFPTKPRE